MKKNIFLISLAFFTGSLFAQGPAKPTPLEAYEGETSFALMKCEATLVLSLSQSNAGIPQNDKSDYRACIAEGKATAKLSLERALKTIRKPKAAEALKNYHVAFVTALEGIRPGGEERKFAYEQRQQALKEKLTEAWARFEIEK